MLDFIEDDIEKCKKLKKTELNLANSNTIDLFRIGKLDCLTKLNLCSNGIDNISQLSQLSQLKELYLSDNHIKDISPLSSLINLEILSLSENKITDLSPLSSLVNLKMLWINCNKISNLKPLLPFLLKKIPIYLQWQFTNNEIVVGENQLSSDLISVIEGGYVSVLNYYK